MTLFFNNLSPETKNKESFHYFFVPLAEQLKESDYEKEQSYRFARQTRVRRKFYTSTDLLEQSEKGRLANLSCYKVALTESEKQQLEASNVDGLFTGFLSFKPSDILSLISFKNGNLQEHGNPFYQAVEDFSKVTSCA
ncbi:MAG: hypothetical protein H0U57_02265 [Tatlockia sp.]|nr:hypothetical protein [Tatlockia sp.]